jgi:hypothetical protein
MLLFVLSADEAHASHELGHMLLLVVLNARRTSLMFLTSPTLGFLDTC